MEKSEEYNKRKIQENDETNEGRWTREEHDKFLELSNMEPIGKK